MVVTDTDVPDLDHTEEKPVKSTAGGGGGRKDVWTLIREEKERASKYVSGDGTKNGVENQGLETTVLFLGGKSSGKSSVVLRFLDRDETPTPTIALEYTFGRRSRAVNSVKDVAHIWELAGGNFLIDLATIPITETNVHLSTVVIVLDLSQPGEITPLFESFLSKLSQHLNAILDSLEKRGSKRPSLLRSQSLRRYGPDHPDLADSKTFLDPFPVPLVVLGTHYDKFRNMESEVRKIVTKYLRVLCHSHGATLVYASSSGQDETTVTRVRGLLNHHAFRLNAPKGNLLHVDHNKPVFVFAGADSYAQIGPAPSAASGVLAASSRNPLMAWKEDMSQLFPIAEKTSSSSMSFSRDSEDPAVVLLEKFPEPAVDAHRAQKDLELEKYRKASERRAKEATIGLQEETRNGGRSYGRNKAGSGLKV